MVARPRVLPLAATIPVASTEGSCERYLSGRPVTDQQPCVGPGDSGLREGSQVQLNDLDPRRGDPDGRKTARFAAGSDHPGRVDGRLVTPVLGAVGP
jgi:hypothetical protein